MEFKNTDVWGFNGALLGMRNPMNSWEKSDSCYCKEAAFCEPCVMNTGEDGGCLKYDCPESFWEDFYSIGRDDLKLAQSLIRAGSEHCKFLRMIHVQVNVDMPRYWWSETDTYHFGTKNSCSTMHKLLNNDEPITKNLFEICEEDADIWEKNIERLEELRGEYRHLQKSRDENKVEKMNRLLIRAKRLLPEGFLQMRTWDTNYAELRNMYFQRKNHRLKEEWQDTFCEWIKTLPYAKELIMYEGE